MLTSIQSAGVTRGESEDHTGKKVSKSDPGFEIQETHHQKSKTGHK